MAGNVPPPPKSPKSWHTSLLALTRDQSNQRLSDVLRCHLVLETVIEFACVRRGISQNKIKRLKYSDKVNKMRDLYGSDLTDGIYEMSTLIGRLRNSFAHTIDFSIGNDGFYEIFAIELPNMRAKQMDERGLEEKQLLELFIYKAHHLGEAILDVAMADDFESYHEQLREWLDNTRYK